MKKLTKDEENLKRYFMIFIDEGNIIGVYPYEPLVSIDSIKKKASSLNGLPATIMYDLEKSKHINQLKQDKTNHFIVIS